MSWEWMASIWSYPSSCYFVFFHESIILTCTSTALGINLLRSFQTTQIITLFFITPRCGLCIQEEGGQIGEDPKYFLRAHRGFQFSTLHKLHLKSKSQIKTNCGGIWVGGLIKNSSPIFSFKIYENTCCFPSVADKGCALDICTPRNTFFFFFGGNKIN